LTGVLAGNGETAMHSFNQGQAEAKKDRAEDNSSIILYLLGNSWVGEEVWERCGKTMNNMRRRTKKIAEFIFWNILTYLLYSINQVNIFLVGDI
jgi:hypothetical protein